MLLKKVKQSIYFLVVLLCINLHCPELKKIILTILKFYPNYLKVGWTKVYIEKMCQFYSRTSKTKFTVIRHSNIYGEYDKHDLDKSHVFGATITKVMDSESEIVVKGMVKKKEIFYT